MAGHFKVLAFVVVIVISFITMIYETALPTIPAQVFSLIGMSFVFENEKCNVSTMFGTVDKKWFNSREQLYEKRRKILSDGCAQANMTIIEQSYEEIINTVIEKVHGIYFCTIPKVSSTFWKKVLAVMACPGKASSPFDITPMEHKKMPRLNEVSKVELKTFGTNMTSFLFVRDPYARFFSAYENKLYQTNLNYWKSVGRDAVKFARDSPDTVYKNYGFDVTFPELVRYILHLSESGMFIDRHFAPMHNRCNPCLTKFDYVGRFETFSDDAHYLISKWNYEYKDVNIHFDDFEKDTAIDAAIETVDVLFGTKKVLGEIRFPFIKLMLRSWRDLQIRGLLSKHIAFPFKQTDASTVTKEEYMNAFKKALNIPVNRTEVKLQREEALIQAYRQVPLEDMERLRQFVLRDCLLFGYDDRPEKLFNRSKHISIDFVYLDGLKM